MIPGDGVLTKPWEVCCTLLEAGRFGYHLRYLTTPNTVIYEESFDLACRVRGLTPDGYFVMSLPLRLGARTTYWNQPPERANLLAGMPCGVDAVIDRGQRHIMVLIRLSLLESYFQEEKIAGLKQATAKKLMQVDPARIRQLSRWLLELLERCKHVPEPLRSDWAHKVEMELIDQLLSISENRQTHTYQTASKKAKSLDRAIACIHEARPRSLTAADLCRASRNSRRTLEYAFRDAFDLSPNQFLQHLKLHRTHQRLKIAAPGETTVTRIALEEGFVDLSRFAGAYRKLFGEPPSETLRRRHSLSTPLPFAGFDRDARSLV